MSPSPKKPASVVVALRLTPNQLAVLRAVAEKRGIPVPAVIREALSNHIPRFPGQVEAAR